MLINYTFLFIFNDERLLLKIIGIFISSFFSFLFLGFFIISSVSISLYLIFSSESTISKMPLSFLVGSEEKSP